MDINNAALSVTAADARFNTQYRIFGGTGAVSGAFGSVSARNPAVSLLYRDQGTPGRSDDTVSLSYRPATSPVLKGISVGRHIVNAFIDPIRQRQARNLSRGIPLRGKADATG